MYGLREMLPQPPHVVRTIWFPILTRQLTPGIIGSRHSLQYGNSLGIGAFVFPLILLARST